MCSVSGAFWGLSKRGRILLILYLHAPLPLIRHYRAHHNIISCICWCPCGCVIGSADGSFKDQGSSRVRAGVGEEVHCCMGSQVMGDHSKAAKAAGYFVSGLLLV